MSNLTISYGYLIKFFENFYTMSLIEINAVFNKYTHFHMLLCHMSCKAPFSTLFFLKVLKGFKDRFYAKKGKLIIFGYGRTLSKLLIHKVKILISQQKCGPIGNCNSMAFLNVLKVSIEIIYLRF